MYDRRNNLELLLQAVEEHFQDKDYSMEAVNKLHTELSTFYTDDLLQDFVDIVAEEREDGYDDGRDDGYSDGYSTGREIGYEEGYDCQNN